MKVIPGEDRAFVDMATMWVYNITNLGQEELITLFYAEAQWWAVSLTACCPGVDGAEASCAPCRFGGRRLA